MTEDKSSDSKGVCRMRDILFKAKTYNGEWVQGLLAHKDNKWYISNKEGMPFAFEVRPETIGQYTGLKDKNGNKIWENDIVNKVDTNGLGYHRERKCKVSFDELGYWLLTTEYGDGYWLGEFDSEQLEVIGNIFDNPELLNYVDNEASQQAHQEVLKSAT